MGQTNAAWNKNADVKKQYITKTCFATIAMDSFRGAKPAQDKTPKTKLTNSGATLYFFCWIFARAFLYPKSGSAGALADPTKPANTFGQGNPPNKNIFYIKTCKTNTTKCIYQLHRF